MRKDVSLARKVSIVLLWTAIVFDVIGLVISIKEASEVA
jgi:hypothetical protein